MHLTDRKVLGRPVLLYSCNNSRAPFAPQGLALEPDCSGFVCMYVAHVSHRYCNYRTGAYRYLRLWYDRDIGRFIFSGEIP